jgi:phosphatidylserine/phosphatidylglycerophosphate/cardiolipin synthase-like enzyme
MKNSLFTLLLLFGIFTFGFAQNTILEARGMAIGTTVTVKGIATNGSEMDPIRYFQDATAGIAAYGSKVTGVQRGDSITVTGVLKNYNQLLEIDPVTTVVINSTGNPLPQPIVLTPNQIAEQYEGMLVKINHVTFSDAGQLFTGNTKYQFTANGQSGFIYVKNGQDMVGTVIPTGEVDLTALCSQFDYANPYGGYQLLPRDLNDISLTSSIYLTGTLVNTEFTNTSLSFLWETNIAGTTELFYGSTAESVTDNHTSVSGSSAGHQLELSNLNAGEITWVQAFSVSGNDTAKSAITSFATISNSSGKMIAYFNSPVDVSYSTGVDAIYLPQTIDDTLIAYINRAKYTIDFTIYNFNNNGISNISNALKAAANRGVRVRVIGCGTTANMGIDELLNSAVHVLIGPSSSQRTGIMHNKFIIFDAYSPDPNDPLVWTGSTNFTSGQINLDANNVIIVQDQSLARAYQIEFEEMWGSYGDNPNSAKALFGSFKRNNTPHEFVIGGKYVACYFSPSDGVNAKIVEVINTADNDLSIATMLITRTEMAQAIADRKAAGVEANVITDSEGNNSTAVNSILSAALTTHFTFDYVSTGMLHHKYMIVDQYAPASDPMVFTGSHNWSAAADNDNDENTLIIHDATLANIYYQQFVKRFTDNNGMLIELTEPPTATDDIMTINVDHLLTVQVLDNDIIQAPITLSIEVPATQGDSYIPFVNPNIINYLPNQGFLGSDSITYKIAYQADPTLFALAKIYIQVIDDSGIEDAYLQAGLSIFPNPATDELTIQIPEDIKGTTIVSFYNLLGEEVLQQSLANGEQKMILNVKDAKLNQGVYLVKVANGERLAMQKLIIQ